MGARPVVSGRARDRDLMPAVEELGAEREQRRETRVVREAARQRQPHWRRIGVATAAAAVVPGHAAKPGAEVDVEAIAGAVAHQHRLAAEGEGPGGEVVVAVEAVRVAARAEVQVHEELETVAEAIAETEVEIEGAGARGALVGDVHRAAAEAEREQEAFARLGVAAGPDPVRRRRVFVRAGGKALQVALGGRRRAGPTGPAPAPPGADP